MCNSRCTSAHGSAEHCRCDCGGANHGGRDAGPDVSFGSITRRLTAQLDRERAATETRRRPDGTVPALDE